MKRVLLVFLLVLSVVLFSGCTGEEEKTSTVDKADESNNTQTEKNSQTSENKNTTVELESENSTSNPVEESASKTPLIEVPLADGFSRYTDDIFGFSIDYPDTWGQNDVIGSLGGKAFNPTGEDASKAAILVTIYSNESEAKPWIGSKDMFEYMKQNGVIMKFENVTINGREGTEEIYNPKFGTDSDSAIVYVVFDVEDKYYVFNAFASENYESKYEEVIETSLNSFVIDENLKAE